ncbi:hypothetical protein [Pyxidicoccus parkwayensis]|nr:hypothetical protein [Pyxidicoccus parkwaysis]
MKAATAVATGVAVTAEVLRLYREQERDPLEKALAECADLARSKVLLELFEGKSPTEEQCKAVVERDAKGRPVTLAMKLGTEMHEVARECTQARLGRLRPGGFSLEPRYLYDPATGRWRLVSRAKEQSLLKNGPLSELKGSLVPDVVIHTADPRQALAVYDFKFPCVNIDLQPSWRLYPDDHPLAGLAQNDVYKKALSLTEEPAMISPRLGVIR